MSKIKLQNDEAMNHGIVSGPMDGEIDLDESGMLDDSGLMDDSGYVPQIMADYEYVELAIENTIFIRWVVMWSSGDLTGNNLITIRMDIDDGCNPMASGDLGDPIVNGDPKHYELVRYQVNSVGLSAQGQISGSCSAEYIHYPCGKEITEGEENGVDCTPEYRYTSKMFDIVIPTNEENEGEG